MYTKSIIRTLCSLAAIAGLFISCKETSEDLGAPSLEINPSELSFDKGSDTKTITVTATRDWVSSTDAEWISIQPKSGKASKDPVTVEITVLENTGLDRKPGSVEFNIGFDSKTLTVNQKGSGKIEGVIGSIVDGDENENVDIKDVLVTGVTTQSIVITDPTGSILVYAKADPKAKVGDKVNITGTTGKHNGLMQIESPAITVVSSGNTVSYPTPATIDASTISSFNSDVVSYVTFKGVPKKNGQYVNIYVGDITSKDLSLSYYPGDLESLLDKEIEVKGWYVGGGTHFQIVATSVNGKDITSSDGSSSEPAKEMSIAEVLASEEGVNAQVSGTVAGTYKRGFVITDGKDYLLVYDGTKCDAKVKDNVTVIGTTDAYGGLVQLASPAVTVVSSGNELTLPEPKALVGSDFDSYSSTKVEYITYEGVLSVSNSYYNVSVDGASTHTGSLSYVDDSFNASSYDKTAVKVTGFFVGISSSKYVNTMVTDLKPSASAYFNVSAEAVTAKADATSATFEIKSNVAWTVTSDNDAYTVEPASGENDGTVTVKFAANETENDVKVNLTVSTTAEVANKSYTVVLTHKGKSTSTGGSEITLEISGNNSWTKATDNTYGAGYEYTKDDVKYAYYKYKSTSNAIAPKEDHIRVYKSSVLSIVPPAGKKITKVVLNCTKADNCTDMTVLTDNDSTATANAEDLTITWTGEVDSFVAQAVKSQERIKTITITLK